MVAIYRPAGRRPFLGVTGAGLRHVEHNGPKRLEPAPRAPAGPSLN
jgi:hypothetical protein